MLRKRTALSYMKYLFFFAYLLLTSTLAVSQSYESLSHQLDTALNSQFLDYSKPIQVLTPEGFSRESTNGYPLIVIFDKQNVINYDYMLHTIDYLSAFGQIPSCVIVGVEAAPKGGRYLETQLLENTEKAKGELHEQFVFEELIPYLQSRWQVNEQIILIGHSRFGFYSTYLLSRHMNDLLGVVSISPFFKQRETNLITDMMQAVDAYSGDHTVYYRLAVGDTVTDTPEYYEMMDSLQGQDLPAAFDLAGYAYPTADHIISPGLTVNRALYEIFARWNQVQMNFHRIKTHKISQAYEESQSDIREAYGESIPFSLGVLNGTGWRFFQEGEYESAIACWELLMQAYPGYAEGWYYIASAHAELGNPGQADKFSAKALTALKHSTFYTREEKGSLVREIKDQREAH